MSDDGDMWREHHQARQDKRARNREASAVLLREHGIAYEAKNGGAHLVVKAGEHVVDFWPGTGLWVRRGQQKRHRGVRSLIQSIKESQRA